MGLQGPQGPQGDPGLQGDTGPQGPQVSISLSDPIFAEWMEAGIGRYMYEYKTAELGPYPDFETGGQFKVSEEGQVTEIIHRSASKK